MSATGKYRRLKFPSGRIASADVSAIGLKQHHIKALIELDVTNARYLLKSLKKNGKSISMAAWLIKVFADTIKEHDDVHAFLKGNRI